MFVLDQDPRFTHAITADVPVDGGFDSQTFKATYKVLGDTVLAAFDMNGLAGQQDFLRASLVDFADIQDASGQPVAFNDRTRDAMIDLPYARLALVKGYFAGVHKASSGN